MKVVINNSYGKFSVSKEFLEHYSLPFSMRYEVSRYDQRLIEYIETYGSEAASGFSADLVVVNIPAGTFYRIREYDGLESIEYRDSICWLVAD